MFWLDIALAAHKHAERAFFETDDGAADDIPRLRLPGLSDFELAHLGMLIAGGYNPRLVLDADDENDIVTEIDAQLVRALAVLAEADQPALAARWQHAAGHPFALDDALAALCDFARRARADRLPMLYAQGCDHRAGADDD